MKELYNEDYFERGLQLGISGYTAYSWMPMLTLKMAKFLIQDLELKERRILDFGCAKGYLVKALREYGIEAFGYDASDYAISQAPEEIRKYCYCSNKYQIKDVLINNQIDFIICKDVLEHLDENSLIRLLDEFKNTKVNGMYIVVPTSKVDDEKYIIGSYENDTTHILKKSVQWWENILKKELGFQIKMSTNRHGPIKENWTKTHEHGNLFILLKR